MTMILKYFKIIKIVPIKILVFKLPFMTILIISKSWNNNHWLQFYDLTCLNDKKGVIFEINIIWWYFFFKKRVPLTSAKMVASRSVIYAFCLMGKCLECKIQCWGVPLTWKFIMLNWTINFKTRKHKGSLRIAFEEPKE